MVVFFCVLCEKVKNPQNKMLNAEVDHLLSSTLIRLRPLNILYSHGHGHANSVSRSDGPESHMTSSPQTKFTQWVQHGWGPLQYHII